MVPFTFQLTTTKSLSQSKVNIHKFWVLRHGHFCKVIICQPQSIFWNSNIQFYPTYKRKSPYSHISKSLHQLQHQLKSKNLIHFLLGQKPQISSFKSNLSKTLGIIHLGTKFHSICGPVEYKFHASKIQRWYRHKVAVIDIAIQNRKVQEKKKKKDLPILKYSCMEYFTDRGTRLATVYGVIVRRD